MVRVGFLFLRYDVAILCANNVPYKQKHRQYKTTSLFNKIVLSLIPLRMKRRIFADTEP